MYRSLAREWFNWLNVTNNSAAEGNRYKLFEILLFRFARALRGTVLAIIIATIVTMVAQNRSISVRLFENE